MYSHMDLDTELYCSLMYNCMEYFLLLYTHCFHIQKWLKLMACLFIRAALLLVQKTQLKYF